MLSNVAVALAFIQAIPFTILRLQYTHPAARLNQKTRWCSLRRSPIVRPTSRQRTEFSSINYTQIGIIAQ
jgi:hypothetical protein